MHKKNAAALALTAVKTEDQRELTKLVESAKQLFLEAQRPNWGGGIMGPKSQVLFRFPVTPLPLEKEEWVTRTRSKPVFFRAFSVVPTSAFSCLTSVSPCSGFP